MFKTTNGIYLKMISQSKTQSKLTGYSKSNFKNEINLRGLKMN